MHYFCFEVLHVFNRILCYFSFEGGDDVDDEKKKHKNNGINGTHKQT
jgi:hypothetical protein